VVAGVIGVGPDVGQLAEFDLHGAAPSVAFGPRKESLLALAAVPAAVSGTETRRKYLRGTARVKEEKEKREEE
ncbi:MAG: hypothetical protein RMJ52_00975, partial [Gemmataceae bacterium]|nr:hypothetical protein [Gemmataceae bacterium]